MPPSRSSIPLLTTAALLAFAGNSLLCRLALRDGAIDPASFTAIRIASGAAVLLLLVRAGRPRAARHGSWPSAIALFAYAAAFSFAYLELGAAIGTLLLFGAVQTTMIATGLWRGERPSPRVWLGMLVAVAGLLALLLPAANGGSTLGTLLMLAAGIAWGVYSLRGRGAVDPAAATTDNFARACWLAVPLPLFWLGELHADATGIGLAVASGALTSGLGYVAWYAALRGLSATRAAIVQLAVPVLAALGGVIALGEELTPRLLIAGGLVLGGIGAAVPVTRPAEPAGAKAGGSR